MTKTLDELIDYLTDLRSQLGGSICVRQEVALLDENGDYLYLDDDGAVEIVVTHDGSHPADRTLIFTCARRDTP